MTRGRAKVLLLLTFACCAALLLFVSQDSSSLPLSTGWLSPVHLGHGDKATREGVDGMLPSVVAGRIHTANDLSTETVAISSVVDSLTHLKEVAAAAGQLPSSFPGSSSLQSCSAAFSYFTSQHQGVMDRFSRSVASGEDLPDAWSGQSPVCGIHKLYNTTGEFYMLKNAAGPFSGADWTAGEQRVFYLENCQQSLNLPRSQDYSKHLRGSNEPAGTCTDLYIAARLIGPSIVPVDVLRLPSCDFELKGTVMDPGSYHLEIQVVWLDGLGPERVPPSHPVVLRKIHSKYGKKPHQKYVFNAACEMQTHIVGSPFDVTVTSSSSSAQRAAVTLPPCTFQGKRSLHGYGRWVRHDNDIPCNVSTPYCEGDPSLLNDAKPFNEDYLWAPYECKMKFYRYNEGPSGPCASRKGTMLLMGDSTTREYAQSLRLFDLKKANVNVEYANWKLDWQYFSRSMAEKSVARLGKELRGSRPVVLVANLGPLHLIGGLKSSDWEFYVDQWEKLFKSEADGGAGLDFIEKKVFLGPAAIHYATNDMTAQRMLNWMEYAYRKLSPLGFEYVAAWNMTQARSESSWDGVHYSAERGKAQMKHLRRKRRVFKWNGGVSVMLTTALLNMLCFPNQ